MYYTVKPDGRLKETIDFIKENQLYDEELWTLAAEQFGSGLDSENEGWRGEYFGKLMRGACLICKYTADEKLYKILTSAVRLLLTKAESDGRLSSYSRDKEFCGWDMWGRKYAAVGLEYYYEICKDENLKEQILRVLKGHLDYIIARVGNGDGQIPITRTSAALKGMNSSSILKSFVVAYELTGEKRYLDFAKYVISEGGFEGFDMFKAAYEDKIYPFDYPIRKAYEMISCFEGVLEYYKVTKDEKYLVTCVNFAKKIIKSELTFIGSAACLHEWFNHSTATQTFDTPVNMQETCVTVSVMLYFYELYRVTRDKEYLDKIEYSFENAYIGALNTNHSQNHFGFPFDSYSPLINRKRALKEAAGVQYMSNKRPYGCCSAIGATGAGIILALICEKGTDEEYAFRVYEEYSLLDGDREILAVKKTFGKQITRIEITIKENCEKVCRFRIPEWSDGYFATINGNQAFIEEKGGFIEVGKSFAAGDKITVSFKEKTEIVVGTDYGGHTNRFAVRKGGIVYAADARFCDINETFARNVKIEETNAPDGVYKSVKISDENGVETMLIDYSSAGKTWDEKSKVSVWLNRE